MRLSMKQLVPTSLDEYLAEHNVRRRGHRPRDGESGGVTRVELGEGVYAMCPVVATAPAPEEAKSAAADLSSLTSMLQARWKGGATSSETKKQEGLQTGQMRSFRIAKLDPENKIIELQLA